MIERQTQTVPDEMLGCWRRAWIRFADGRVDDSTFVVWLQTESAMADIRISADRLDLRARRGLGDCTLEELAALADSESSSGHTTSTAIVLNSSGLREATAEWLTRGHGVNFQPVTSYPEPGILSWNDSGDVMMEAAPSGAYVEEWRLVPGSRATLSFERSGEDSFRYVAGPVTIRVRDRNVVPHRRARLPELVAELGADRGAVEALLDCEFSYAIDGVVTHSTLPWLEGTTI